jgi:hypothetical protein
MNINTCSYCGSSLGTSPIASNDKCYCGFCEMFVEPSVNGERLERFKKEEFVGYEHMNKTTPELLNMHTKTLLHLLRLMREDRRSYFDNMRILKKAASDSPEEFKDGVKMSSDEYERITKKCFIVENILRDRMGYIPKKITNDLLLSYEERVKDPNNNKLMNIRKPDMKKPEIQKGINLSEVISCTDNLRLCKP